MIARLFTMFTVTLPLFRCYFRAIKMTSPSLNIFIAFGCILLYASVYVNGLDHSTFDDMSLAALCYVSITFGIHSLDIPKM